LFIYRDSKTNFRLFIFILFSFKGPCWLCWLQWCPWKRRSSRRSRCTWQGWQTWRPFIRR
jgi:hypothetical protein